MNIITPKANKIMTVGENVKPLLLLVAPIEELIPKKAPINIKTTPITLEIALKM